MRCCLSTMARPWLTAYTQFLPRGPVLATSPGSVRQSEAQTATFSLTFQDAIKDGLRAVQNCVEDEVWEVGRFSDQQWNC